MKTLISICRAVVQLPEEEFAQAERMAQEQCEYSHPFKMATAERQHKLGAHNKAVIEKVRELKELINSGANI